MDERHPILRADVCLCCESRRAMVYTQLEPKLHELECKQCGRSAIAGTIDELIESWNDLQCRLRVHRAYRDCKQKEG